MKDIKFRAWAGSHMVYRDLSDREWHLPDGMPVASVERTDNENLKLMQYTGLTDRDGKEIYEGDIVKCFYPNEVKIMEVVFNQNTVSYEFRGEEIYDSLVNASNFEVIGNIYENKELLDEGSGDE